MRQDFHQLERRLEHLRVRQRRLLASLAASGQQTPIIVVRAEQPDRYLVIDGCPSPTEQVLLVQKLSSTRSGRTNHSAVNSR
jgi:uncharacterized metal-binding protein